MERKSKQTEQPEGLTVFVNNSNDYKKEKLNFEYALKDFKKKVKKSGIMNELRRRESYMSPSKYKRWRKNEAVKRRKRDEKKQDWSDTQSEW